MTSRPRPGGQPRIIGDLSLRLHTEGGAEAEQNINRLKTISQALMDTNAKMLAKRSPVAVLAADAGLAKKAFSSLKRGTLEKFTGWIDKSNGSLNERIFMLNKLEKAYINSIKAGEPIFSEEQYKALVEQREEYEKINNQVDESANKAKTLVSHLGNFNNLFGKIFNVASKLFGHIINGFRQAIPLQGEAAQGVNAITFGFKTASSAAKLFIKSYIKLFKKTSSIVISAATGLGKAIKGIFSNDGKSETKVSFKNLLSFLNVAAIKIVAVTSAITALTIAIGFLIPPLGLFIATIGVIGAAFKLAIDGFRKIIALQDAFRISTFRSMGSISELTKATAELGFETSLGIDINMMSIKAMNEAGISAGTLAKGFVDLSGNIVTGTAALKASAAAITSLHYITGVAQEEIAKFQKAMIEVTGTSWQASSAIMTMVQAQKQFGLSSKDIAVAMRTIGKLQSRFRLTVNQTNMLKFNKGLMEMQGAAKRAGVSIDEVSRLITDVSDNMDKFFVVASMGGKLGEFINTNDINVRMKAVEAGALRMLKVAEKMRGYEREIYLSITGLSKDQLLMIKARHMALTNEEKMRVKILKRQEAQNKITQEFNNASKTLMARLRQIFAPIISEAARNVQGFVEELTKMAGYIQGKIKPLWEELGNLINDIFGVKFSGSDTMKTIIDKIIDGFNNAVDNARAMIKWIKEMINEIKTTINEIRGVINSYKKHDNEFTTITESSFGDWVIALTPNWIANSLDLKTAWEKEDAEQRERTLTQAKLAEQLRKQRMREKLTTIKSNQEQTGLIMDGERSLTKFIFEQQNERADIKKKAEEAAMKAKKNSIEKMKDMEKKAEEAAIKAKKNSIEKIKDMEKKATITNKGIYGKELKEIYRKRGLNVEDMKMFQNSTVSPTNSTIVKASVNATKEIAKTKATTAESEPVPGVVISSKSKTDDKALLFANKTQAEILSEIHNLLVEMNGKLKIEEKAQITEPKSRRSKNNSKRNRTLR